MMGSRANVKSIDAIRQFRADLQTYEDSLRQTRDMLSAELKRAVDYFESDRATYWPHKSAERATGLPKRGSISSAAK